MALLDIAGHPRMFFGGGLHHKNYKFHDWHFSKNLLDII